MSTASLFKTASPASAAAPASSSPKTTTKSLFAQPVPAQASTTQATPALQSSTQFGTSSTNQPASARLKNKSMDEILTRWATDLAKHQKEFQKQAMQVAEWDRILVDNTDKIGKLLAKTFQAERDASEVEKQLAGVESQQEELDQYLDRYEKEVDDMIQKHGMTQDTAGLDIERERT
jgi:nuclear pore complex protein Nup62